MVADVLGEVGAVRANYIPYVPGSLPKDLSNQQELYLNRYQTHPNLKLFS